MKFYCLSLFEVVDKVFLKLEMVGGFKKFYFIKDYSFLKFCYNVVIRMFC